MEDNSEAASHAADQAYDREAFINHYNENAGSYDALEEENCTLLEDLLSSEAAMLVILAEEITSGGTIVGGSSLSELTDSSDEGWAKVLALTLRAVELGCGGT